MRKEGLVMKRRALSTLMALSLFCAGGAAMADGAYTPGTYTVSADGNNGAITLRVEMTSDAIADIKVVSQSETAGLGDVAIDKMIEAILVAGNTDVDTVSQATVSSEAVIAAVNAALSRAEKGEVDTVASPVAEAVTEETFADQCKAAGIDFTYEDPNASIYDFQTTDAAVDVITHASGKAKYVDETDGPCIRTPLDLAARSAVKVKVYYWIADENGVSTLEEATKLENAQYVSVPFPNDGGKYAIKLQSNGLGTNTVVTIDENNEPTVAIFGLKYTVDENGTDVYTSCAVMAETATYRNLIAGSPIVISYYEYNPFTEKKIGIGARNAGARVQCELDQQRSMLTTIPAEGETAQKISVADYLAMDEDARNAIQIKYITMVAKVVALYSIGWYPNSKGLPCTICTAALFTMALFQSPTRGHCLRVVPVQSRERESRGSKTLWQGQGAAPLGFPNQHAEVV